MVARAGLGKEGQSGQQRTEEGALVASDIDASILNKKSPSGTPESPLSPSRPPSRDTPAPTPENTPEKNPEKKLPENERRNQIVMHPTGSWTGR